MENQTLLFNLYQHYLSPTGLVMERLKGSIKVDPLMKDPNNIEPWFPKNSIYTPDLDTFEQYLETITEQRDKLNDWPDAYNLMSQLIYNLQAYQKTYQESLNPNREEFYHSCTNAVKIARNELQYHHGSIPTINHMLDLLDQFLQFLGCSFFKTHEAKILDKLTPILKDTYQVHPKEPPCDETAEENSEFIKKK